MSWFVLWHEMIKNGSVRYILQRYLGQYFEEKLSVEQLSVDLSKGIGSISNIVLDVQALNELGEQYNLPIEFVDGSITKVTVRVPWSSILTESSSVQIDGLSLVIQPKQREDCATSMFESMWSSMTTSIQLAEECLKQSAESNPEKPVNGVHEVAKAIDTVFARVKVDFYDTIIRLEHLPKDTCHGSAIKINIKHFSYQDETNPESFDDMPTMPTSAYSVKLFCFDGVDFCSNEFYASHRTMCRSLLMQSNMNEQQSKMSDTDSIVFAKFLGKQEIRLKIKQKENVSGPKFDVEVNGSSLVSYISPRQLRTVCEVLCGLMSPHLQDSSNMCNKSRINAKPMTTSDYERVEQELNQHINPSSLNNFVSKSLQNAAGWSSAGGLEDESDDDFHPVAGHVVNSLTSSVSNSVSSSCHSTSSSYHLSSKASEQYSFPSQSSSHYQQGRLKEKSSSSEPDFSGEINSFQLRLNFLAVILLHQDVLQTSNNFKIPDETSVEKMKSLSDKFFSQFITLSASSGRNDFKNGRQILQYSVDKNHFRFYCTTLIANAEEKSNPSNSELHGAVTVANLELVECLFEMKNQKQQFVDLLCFTNRSDSNDASMFSQPDFILHFKHIKNLKHYSIPNRLEFTVNLLKCQTEIDVTIIDRLSHLLENLDELMKTLDKGSNNSNKNILNDVHTPLVEMKVQWKISSPMMVVKLRFPIPDLRTESDGNDSYWFKRDVYNDILFIELIEMSAQNLNSNHQVARNFELQCKSVQVDFQEANCDKCVPIIFSGIDEKYCQSLPNAGRGFDWPRVVLRVYPKVGYIELEDEEEEKLDFNVSGPMFQSIIQTPKETSPFSSKIIMRETNTAHSKKTSSENDGEEIILPGTKEEIGEFIEGASRNALIQLNVTLPSITIQLPSKYLYEVIYNRFNNDLLLWTPKSWKQRSNKAQTASAGPDCNFGFNSANSMFASFSLCKSAIRNNGDSDDDDQSENLLLNDESCPASSKQNKSPQQQQSNVAISLFASQGVVDVLPHARDSSGKVIPGQFGEIQIVFQEADLFLVSGYKSKPLLNYVCLQINHIGLYHSSLIPAGTEISLKSFDSYPSQHLMPTLYKTDQDANINDNAKPVGIGSANGDDMLTLAIRSQGQENRVKNICVANSLNGVTIRHRMKAPYTSWLSQLINFFDVVDYPILHYQPWKIITQLHQQFINCVIDYRPLHLPLRAALTIENFNISSNITAKTSTSILRLIAEEGSLFISKKVDSPNDVPENLALNLRKDYVCVIEMGLFELSLRLTDGGEGPQTDLRASNNVVRLRTCADSAVALLDLVKYIASDGDLHDGLNNEFASNNSKNANEKMLVTLEETEKENIGNNADFNFSHGSLDGSSLKKEVPELVEEAMNDMTEITQPKKRSANKRMRLRERRNIEVFYFPDEENSSHNVLVGEVLSESDTTDDDFETEFCILEAESGIGYLGNTKVPEVRLLTKEPIKMVDNHFTVPLGKEDVLKAPKNYPVPVSKYTLREMSIVWHMYGGSDFSAVEEKDSKDSKKHVTIPTKGSSETSLHSISSNSSKKSTVDVNSVSFSVGKCYEAPTVNFMVPKVPTQVNFSGSLNEGSSVLYDKHQNSRWQARGGPNRDHDSLMELKLTKVKYQYEVYPKTTKQASRQVLLVQEVEIRDRMATSQINKFLYQYSSSSRPKQSNAYMVMIKATNIRPEQNISSLQECCLRVSLLPLRLNIDQDSLLFLIKFFSDIAGNSNSANTTGDTAKPNPSPVMNIEDIKVTESPTLMVEVDSEKAAATSESTRSPVFIRSFVFSPEVPIRLDYEPKRVDLKRGPLAGLIMGLGQLNCSELKLKKIYHRYGFLGLEKLLSYILAEWLQDIKKNQLPSILGGVGPIYSLVQLFQGIRDLFWLPIEQYQKDGRIVRGLQRGANSFTTSSAMAVLEITARLVYAIQRIAETAFDIVSPGPSIKHVRLYDRSERLKNNNRSRRANKKSNQPADIREGFASAFQLVKDGFGETAQTLVRVASVEHEVKGAVGAVGGVLREIPSTAIRPIIIASQATTNVLDGVRSQLVPDARAEAALKWRSDYF